MSQTTERTGDPADPVRIAIPRMRKRRNRAAWTMVVATAISVVCFLAYKWWSRPVVVSVAVSETDVDDVRVMNAFSHVMGAGQRHGVALKVVPVESAAKAVEAFRDRKVDLVVARADADLRGMGNAIALLRKSFGVVIALQSRIDSVQKLRGRRVATIGAPIVTDSFLRALLQAYELSPSDVTLVPMLDQAALKMVENRSVDAVIAVSSIATGRSADAIRGLTRGKAKDKLSFLAIDRAADVVRLNPAFAAEDIDKGAYGDAPPEAVPTVSIGVYVLASSQMPNDVAATLARQFLSNRQAVLNEAPEAAQIAAPEVEKDAYIRVHPGVANYINNEEQTFFDKYGDLMYILMAVGGVFGSGLVALRRSFGPDREGEACDLVDELIDLRRSVRAMATDPAFSASDLSSAWTRASQHFEDMLARALPLIGDASVEDRTIQALSTALTATERAIADLAPMAFRGARGQGDAQIPPRQQSDVAS